MDIDVDELRLHLKMQQRKRIFMLHHVALIAVLDGLCYDAAFDISSIDKIIFKIPVPSGDHRLSDEAGNSEPVGLHVDGNQVCGNLPAVNRVDDVL